MRKLVFLCLAILCIQLGQAQQAAAVDSIKQALSKATTVEERAELLDVLSRLLMNVDLQEADNYGQQLITLAEESRDRKLMVKAYLSNGTRCSYFAGMKDYTKRCIDYYNSALSIAKKNKMDDYVAGTNIRLAAIHLSIPEKDKALNYVNLAFSIISGMKNDSLRAEVSNMYGHVYLARNDKIMALRNYLIGLRIAEESKNPSLIRSGYVNLSNFYNGIEDFDRAIDYSVKAFNILDEMKDKNVPYQRAMDINNLGKLYASKKNYDMAIAYFKRSLSMADSLKFSTMKIPGYLSLLNQYLRMDQPQRALEYFNSREGMELRSHLIKFGFAGTIDQAFGVIFTELHQYDSARVFFAKAAPFFENNPNESTRLSFYAQLGTLYKRTGEYQKAIDMYLKVKAIADKNGQLENAERAAKHLDTLYRQAGDFQLASQYNSIYYQYKDSIESINKEKELAQVEAADEQYRQQKLAEELAEKKRRANNIQYMAITIGIAGLFIMLVVLGMFKVSARTIRLIGFFAFIMFFEFIFLLVKKDLYGITRGEPWKDLAAMIVLAALLVPAHHWLEHKVIKYLTSHNRLTATGRNLMSKVFIRRKSGHEETKV